MAGFDHAHQEQEAEDLATAARNSRYGMVLFLVYSAAYFGFVAISAFRADLMESTPLAGINTAVLYGFALILGAFALALVYGWICRAAVDASQGRGGAA